MMSLPQRLKELETMRSNLVPAIIGLLGLLAVSTPLPALAQTAANTPQSADASAGDGADPSLPQHQLEFRPLIDMPRDEGFVTELLLMRAHLLVGMALYQAGVQDQAVAHCSHPIEELYDDLALQLDDRGLPPFGGDLRALRV
jgi:hypothetical protein